MSAVHIGVGATRSVSRDLWARAIKPLIWKNKVIGWHIREHVVDRIMPYELRTGLHFAETIHTGWSGHQDLASEWPLGGVVRFYGSTRPRRTRPFRRLDVTPNPFGRQRAEWEEYHEFFAQG